MFIPKISFILPIYNVGSYLSEAVESILCQPISKEIILVDDGSTDGSLDIAIAYAGKYPFISVIHSQNCGLPSARNKGFRLAKGQYVMFIDPDDTLFEALPFELMISTAEQHNVPVIKGNFYWYSPNNRELERQMPNLHGNIQDNTAKISPLLECLKLAYSANSNPFIQVGCWIINRNWLMSTGIRFREDLLNFAEDTLFNIDLFMQKGSLIEFPINFIKYRINDNSAVYSKPSFLKISSTYKAMCQIQDIVSKTLDNEIKYYLDAACVLLFIHFLKMLETASEKDKELASHFDIQHFIYLLRELQRSGVK